MSEQGETILLVNDSKTARRAMARLLAELNYRIIEASGGCDGIERYADHQDQISLVIMDVVIPRMGGLEAVRWIRKRNPELPVLFTTAYSLYHVEDVLDYSLSLNKPVPIYLHLDPASVVTHIAQALDLPSYMKKSAHHQ